MVSVRQSQLEYCDDSGTRGDIPQPGIEVEAGCVCADVSGHGVAAVRMVHPSCLYAYPIIRPFHTTA